MSQAMLLYLSRSKWAEIFVMKWRITRLVARRFIAGETIDEAIETIRKLKREDITVTLDILGESVTNKIEASHTVAAYMNLLERIDEEKLHPWISLKLTALGLDINPELCHKNIQKILQFASKREIYVTIDMEDHTYTQRTIDLFNKLRIEGFDNVRTVIQSYLYRSDEDIASFVKKAAGIRLCKGAYREPANIAYPKKQDVDAAFLRQIKILLNAAKEGRGYPGIATHDENIIKATKAFVANHNIPKDRFEFQLLYGIRTILQKQLIM